MLKYHVYTIKSVNSHILVLSFIFLFIYLFGVLHRFQYCTGHITTGSWKGRGNQYIQFVRILYCKLPTNGKQLPAFQLQAVTGIEPRPQRWEAFSTVIDKYFYVKFKTSLLKQHQRYQYPTAQGLVLDTMLHIELSV